MSTRQELVKELEDALAVYDSAYDATYVTHAYADAGYAAAVAALIAMAARTALAEYEENT